MIELRNVDVLKSGIKLFENFSWEIKPEEHWVISGPNGCGKTTLLEIIAGDVHVRSGEVAYEFISGTSWDDRYAQRKKNIHYIPAHPVQSFLQSDQGSYYQQRYYGMGDERVPLVRDLLGGEIHHLKKFRIPETLSIEPLLDVEVTRLSNGQLKKVLFLKILLKDIPRFLLLDYPFEGLDAESRKDLCDFIDFIANEYTIQIMLTDNHHHLPTVMNRRLMLDSFLVSKKENLQAETWENPKAGKNESEPFVGSNPVVEIKRLKIQYGERVILKDFNWKVSQGERWALVGKNGSGKTTLFSMIFADHPMAYSQEIYLFGKRRGTGESIWDIKRRINYLGPELISYLSPKSIPLTARRYIRSINKSLHDNKFEELILHFRAENFIDKPVRLLSSGQLQLMLIMNCFLTEKEMLLLDEPFQFLDIEQRRNLSHYLQTHLSRKTTLILITHYQKDLDEWTEHTKRL
jgi:molybdate transport system ATP-binding protein